MVGWFVVPADDEKEGSFPPSESDAMEGGHRRLFRFRSLSRPRRQMGWTTEWGTTLATTAPPREGRSSRVCRMVDWKTTVVSRRRWRGKGEEKKKTARREGKEGLWGGHQRRGRWRCWWSKASP